VLTNRKVFRFRTPVATRPCFISVCASWSRGFQWGFQCCSDFIRNSYRGYHGSCDWGVYVLNTAHVEVF